MNNAEDLQATIGIEVPKKLIDAIAERVVSLLSERVESEPERWIGVDQAAVHLACPKSRIYDLVSARRIPHERDGSRLLFRRADLDEWVSSRGGKRR
jgi:excisionase family DNA binding protein